MLHRLVLANAALDVPDQLLARCTLSLSLRLFRCCTRAALLLSLRLSLLKERLELCAREGRMLGVLVHREVLQLLLDRRDARLAREGREERANHVVGHHVGHVGRDVAEGDLRRSREAGGRGIGSLGQRQLGSRAGASLLRRLVNLRLVEEVLLVEEELLLLVLLLEVLEVGRGRSVHTGGETKGLTGRREGRLALGRVGTLLRCELGGGAELLLLLEVLLLGLLELLLRLLLLHSSIAHHVRLDFFERERSSSPLLLGRLLST